VTVTSVQKDPENLTMTVTADLDAPPDRVWELWADPRQFERWWGAPGYAAKATALDLRTGGKVEFHLSGPDGDTPNNIWDVVEADRPHRLVLRDAIVDENEVPTDEGPSSFTVRFEPIAQGRTRMSIESKFPSAEALKVAVDMDMDKMLEWSFGQMAVIIAESQAPAGAATR
jgi:uncharacterized protein YndB with AHSA1/START domain